MTYSRLENMGWLAPVCWLLGALLPALSQRTGERKRTTKLRTASLDSLTSNYLGLSSASLKTPHTSKLQMFTVLICKAPSPSLPQVDVDGECGAELTTQKLNRFDPVIDGECEALMAFNVVSV